MVTIWDDHEVQDNYAGGDAGRRARPVASATRRRARRRGYKAFFESMPFYARPDQAGLPLAAPRQQRRPDHARPAPVPRRPAVRRRRRAAVPGAGTAARRSSGAGRWTGSSSACSSSKATWKVIGSQTMMMPAKVTGGAYFGFDSWQGYPQEREELLAHIKDEGIEDVVFITGDIHLFLAGDVRTNLGDGESVAVEFVGGSITSTELRRDRHPRRRRHGDPGQRREPEHRRRRSSTRCARSTRGSTRPTSTTTATRSSRPSRIGFDVHAQRVPSIKKRSRKLLTTNGFRYRLARGQKSIKGVNGPTREPPPAAGAARLERDARGGGRRDGGGRAVPARHHAAAGPGGPAESPWVARGAPSRPSTAEPPLARKYSDPDRVLVLWAHECQRPGSLENPEVRDDVPGHVIPILEREFDDFDNEAEKFLAGDMTENEFIGFRLKQGVYGQRQADVQMIRVKLPFGGITPEQMDTFADVDRALGAAQQGPHHHAAEHPDPPRAAARRRRPDPRDLRRRAVQPRGLRQHRPQRDRRSVGRRLPRRDLRPDAVRGRLRALLRAPSHDAADAAQGQDRVHGLRHRPRAHRHP